MKAEPVVTGMQKPVPGSSNGWIKKKLGLGQFRLRGRVKVGLEALWACLTCEIQQWIRLVWRPQQQTAPVAARAAW